MLLVHSMLDFLETHELHVFCGLLRLLPQFLSLWGTQYFYLVFSFLEFISSQQ